MCLKSRFAHAKIKNRTARLCNVHRIGNITAPVILRQRKNHCGLPIVRKIVKLIHIPPGRGITSLVDQIHIIH